MPSPAPSQSRAERAPAHATPAPTTPQPLGPALDPAYYLDERAAADERTEIFDHSWQLVGHESDLPAPGARFAAPLAGGREVLVVRREDGQLAGHLNVCRHRGARLVSGAEPEAKPAIRCPYHGWTYHLDGKLVGAPEGRQIPCLDKTKLGLLPVRVESFLGFIFANPDPDAPSLAQSCAGLLETAARYCGTDLRPVGKARIFQAEGVERQAANWKVVVDNYLEGYHVPVAHPGLMRLFDYQRYIATDETDGYALFQVHLRDKPSSNLIERLYQKLARPMPGLAATDHKVWRFAIIYPNTLIDLYPDHVLAWSVLPDGVGHATLPGAYFAKPGGGLRTWLARRLNIHIGWITNDEDADLVARVQRGLATPGFRPGPLAHRETGVAWFHRNVRRDLAGRYDADGPAE
jgi:choline monooxygenase